MLYIDDYIKDVCLYIKCRRAHKEVRDELYDHISEIKERLIFDGMSDGAAELQAVLSMGDSRLVGEELNKKYKPQTSWSLLGLFAVIIIFSGVFFYMFSNDEDIFQNYVKIGSYVVWVGISLVFMFITMFSNYTKLNKYAVYIICGFIITALFLILGDININGFVALFIFGFRLKFNIADLLLLSVIPIGALIYRSQNKGMSAILKICAVGLIFSFIFFMSRGGLTEFMIFSLCIFIVVTVGVMKKHFRISRGLYIFICVFGVILFVMLIWTYISGPNYASVRLNAFLTRGQSDPQGGGWTIVQADYMLGHSKMFGAADSVNYSHLPGLSYNFILVNIIAHLGWAAGIAVIAAVSAFIIQLFRITAKIKNSLGFYVALSASVMLALRFVTGVLMNFSLIPSADFYIPFLSYQGSGYIADMILLGTVLSVWRYNRIFSRSPEIKKKNSPGILEKLGEKIARNSFIRKIREYIFCDYEDDDFDYTDDYDFYGENEIHYHYITRTKERPYIRLSFRRECETDDICPDCGGKISKYVHTDGNGNEIVIYRCGKCRGWE